MNQSLKVEEKQPKKMHINLKIAFVIGFILSLLPIAYVIFTEFLDIIHIGHGFLHKIPAFFEIKQFFGSYYVFIAALIINLIGLSRFNQYRKLSLTGLCLLLLRLLSTVILFFLYLFNW